MPTNLVICVKNAIDFGTITASPSLVLTLPPSNLQLPSRGRVARTVTAGVGVSQEYFVTWGGQGWYLNFLKFARNNFEAGTYWRVQVYSDAAWTNQIHDSGVVPVYDFDTLGELDFGRSPLGQGAFDGALGQRYSLTYFDRVLALSVKITVTGANSSGCLEASRLFAGDYTEFLWNPEASDFGWDETTEQSRSLGGTLRSDGGVGFRTLDLSLAIKDEAQRAQLADMLRYAGLRYDLFLSLFPGAGGELERDHTFLAKFFGRLPKLQATAGTDITKTRLSFQEV